MPRPRNAMEVFKLLDQSNCRECGEKTCLAFAGAVYQGRKKIQRCPKLDQTVLSRFSDNSERQNTAEPNRDEYLAMLQTEVCSIDLAAAAERVGAEFSGGKLKVKVLGKDFSVDTKGQLAADIHINPWVAIPFLDYIRYGKGLPVAGSWLSFRELKDGKQRYPLFQKRCEAPLKKVADIYTDLFDDLAHLFGGIRVEKQFESDISMVLHPLPRVPIMICYWLPEDGLDSSLNVFFDATADQNLTIGSVFSLGTGLCQMFEKLALRHGFPNI
ncbi:hypothetical protein D1AOALGA4SA_12416 [Olavius algarvensis Delta 1 endosymbiont]|nr:hypothetical protein D1AOALGA4SA_12416 [Olavius algarvensis Delta 1 endosymbiont]